MTAPVSWQVIPLSDQAGWHEALRDVPHAIAHTWAYAVAMQATSGTWTGLFVCSSDRARYVCPVSVREFQGTTDICTPAGFAGPVGGGDIADFRGAWSEFVASRGAISGYVALHPVLRPEALATDPTANVHGRCSLIELDGSIDAVWQGMSANPRRILRRFLADEMTLESDRATLASAFLDLYGPFMRSKGAGPRYAFADETLRSLCHLDDVLVMGYPEHEPRAVALFGATEHGAEYLYGVAQPDARKYLLLFIWRAIEHYVDRGVPWLSLGGGGPTLAEFKRRLGAYRVPMYALKEIYAPDEYARLCRAVGADPEVEGYFPAYRSV
jgi:hypothetical protein